MTGISGRVGELIRHWMLSGSEPDEYALSELYEAARGAAADGLPAGDAFRACCVTAWAVWDTLVKSTSPEELGWLMPQADVLWAFLDIAPGSGPGGVR